MNDPSVRVKVPAVPDTEVSFRVPSERIRCGAPDTIKLQQTIKGGQINLEWLCIVCNGEWPVKRRDEQPRV